MNSKEKINLEEKIKNDLINEEEANYDSLENIMLKELKNIIRICDICGGEMMLVDTNLFICQDCGYHLKV